jgi:aquaporin related protein
MSVLTPMIEDETDHPSSARSTFLAPIGIGLALFIAELYATPFTSGALNPARALGPDVIAAKFDG